VIDLRLGDCLEILPTLQGVDAVVSDPPYGMGKYNKFGSRGNLTDAQPYTPIVGDDKPFDPTPFLDFSEGDFIWRKLVSQSLA
jgi:site-specific DNA-methyltransferase (adenine-specific)